MQRFAVVLILAAALTLGFFAWQPTEAAVEPMPIAVEEDKEVCDKSLGGWENAESAAQSKALADCQAQGCTGIQVTGGRYYREDDWYVHCLTYTCTGCGGGGGGVAQPAAAACD